MKVPEIEQSDDRQLVESVRGGDSSAFEELVRRYQEIAFRTAYLVVGDADEARDAAQEGFLRAHVDFVGSSERWGVEKPDAAFFARVVDEAEAPAGEILYVGDRVDNDVLPALAAGLHAVRIRRGEHAHIESPAGVVTVGSLDELPEVLADV